MNTMKFWAIVVSICCESFATETAQANYVVNGSFEAVQIGSPYLSTNPATIPGWTHTGSVGDSLLFAVGYSDNLGSITTAGDGKQFVTIGGGFGGSGTGYWSQTLIGLTPATSYSLSFEMASEAAYSGSQSITVDFTGGSSTAPQTFSAAPTSVNYWRGWETKTMTFVASSSSVTLRFGATAQYDVGLDNVIVNPSVVPEPSTVILTSLGLLGALASMRRRKT